MSILYPRGSEFRSCTTSVRIEKNLEEGEKWGLKALEKDPDDSYIPYYIGRYIYRPQKRREEAGEMLDDLFEAGEDNSMNDLTSIIIVVVIVLFIKVLFDRWRNKEDDHYSKTVDK